MNPLKTVRDIFGDELAASVTPVYHLDEENESYLSL